MGDSALINITTSLDEGAPEQIPQKLEELWNALARSVQGGFHASEKVALRWLLKIMNGPSPEAEKVRRYPLTWRIMGCVFNRIPLFSLAKALADRRFILVLQQTVRDLSTPAAAAAVAADRKQPKRKRSTEASFDIDALRGPQGCLHSAEQLFGALLVVLSRIAPGAVEAAPIDRIGAEHIRSLFCSPAADAVSIVGPLLRICELAFDEQESDQLEGQASWIATAAAVWDLHLQNSQDALEFASRLSTTCFLLLGKLQGVGKDPVSASTIVAGASALGREIRVKWLIELLELLTSNFILPARSDFLTRKVNEVTATPIMLGNVPPSILCPTMFVLVLEAPHAIGGISAKRDNAGWLDMVFNLLEGTLRRLTPNIRNSVMLSLLQTALEHQYTPPLSTMRTVCEEYAFAGGDDGNPDWRLLSAVADCDADVFLVSEEGAALLGRVLALTPKSTVSDEGVHGALCSLILSLANGYVRARGLSAFIRKWFEHLVICHSSNPTGSVSGIFWFDRDIGHAVSKVVQESLTARQLSELVISIGQQIGPSAEAARGVIYDAISQGISSEEVAENVIPGMFAQVWGANTCFTAPEVSSAQWRVAARAIRWNMGEEDDRVWNSANKRVSDRLQKVLESSPLSSIETFDAFRCAVAAWISLYAGDDSLTSSSEPKLVKSGFLERLSTELGRDGIRGDGLCQLWVDNPGSLVGIGAFQSLPVGSDSLSASTYLGWILLGFPRLIPMLAETYPGTSTFLRAVLASVGAQASTAPGTNTTKLGKDLPDALCRSLAACFTMAPTSFNFKGQLIDILQPVAGKGTLSQEQMAAVQVLLKAPADYLSRDNREQIFASLLSHTKGDLSDSFERLSTWEPLVALMVQMMRRPTFYAGMRFDDLLELGESIERCVSPKGKKSNNKIKKKQQQQSNLTPTGTVATVAVFALFSELVCLTMSQMATRSEPREIDYLSEVLPALPQIPDGSVLPLIFLSGLVTAVSSSPVAHTISPKVPGLDGIEQRLNNLLACNFRQLFEPINPDADTSCLQPRTEVGHYLKLWATLEVSERYWDQSIDQVVAPLRNSMASVLRALGRDDLSVRPLFSSVLSMRLNHIEAHARQPAEMASREQTGCEDEVDNWLVFDAAHILREARPHFQEREGGNDAGKVSPWVLTLQEMASRLEDGPILPGQLLALRQVARHITDNSSSAGPGSDVSLGKALSTLTRCLVRASSVSQLVDLARIICPLLDGKSTLVTQWTVEQTLSSVVILCSESAPHKEQIRGSPKTYEWLCRLTEVILKRHRRRLEGHLHLLVTVLEALLTCLVRRRFDSRRGAWAVGPAGLAAGPAGPAGAPASNYSHWESHAKTYGRLLSLVCEPSAASVMRSQPSKLDSETDAAKRSAGQYMYLVVMHFIKLQLDTDVPHGVREALMPGLYSILNITPPECRIIMVDAMDASGRAIWKDLYNKYRKFGRWKGT